MSFIEKIKSPIRDEMQEFDKVYNAVLDSDNPLLNDVHNYILESNGKKLRPILAILAAKLLREVNTETLYGAFALELLHTASLVHDDVIDDTLERRGRESVNARWNNKVAVLTGDYLLSKASYCAYTTKNVDIIAAISQVALTLTDGELLQLSVDKMSDIDEELYYNIIQRKTAELFATCMEVGALSVGASDEELNRLKNFGNALGICFQIKDDVFDYYENADIGKPTGNDVRDGKLTLPLIYALRTSQSEERDEIVCLLDKKDFSQENIQRIMQFAHDEGGLEYAKSEMDRYNQIALDELKDFPDSDVKQALIRCVDFVSSRSF
ncbi:MAG TPA: polyprenyl synthetase family protein [Bacteroidales bacterium]|nr:polyprenyl synthetase family protein [Bacteroidales bacterium]